MGVRACVLVSAFIPPQDTGLLVAGRPAGSCLCWALGWDDWYIMTFGSCYPEEAKDSNLADASRF